MEEREKEQKQRKLNFSHTHTHVRVGKKFHWKRIFGLACSGISIQTKIKLPTKNVWIFCPFIHMCRRQFASVFCIFKVKIFVEPSLIFNFIGNCQVSISWYNFVNIIHKLSCGRTWPKDTIPFFFTFEKWKKTQSTCVNTRFTTHTKFK